MKKVYLDYNATTPVAREVLEEIVSVLERGWGNPSSCYENGVVARDIIEKSRKQVADMISCDPQEIIFTSGGTESNNLILHSAIKQFTLKTRKVSVASDLGTGEHISVMPHIISSDMEHDSIRLTLTHFSEAGIAEVSYISSNPVTGCIDIEKLFKNIQPNTCLITVMMANNESGVIQPIPEIGRRVQDLNTERQANDLLPVYFHSDAAQAIGKIPVDVDDLNVNFLTIVGHKFYGPRIGALFARGAPVLPMFYGGGQERNIRPGTPNTCMIAGLGKACELVTLNLKKYHDHMKDTRDYLEQQLLETFPEKIHFNGKFPGSQRIPNTCNVSILGAEFKGDVILSAVEGFEASVGAACHSDRMHCASPVLLSIGIPEEVALNAMRLSVGRETTREDMDMVVSDIRRVVLHLSQKTRSSIPDASQSLPI